MNEIKQHKKTTWTKKQHGKKVTKPWASFYQKRTTQNVRKTLFSKLLNMQKKVDTGLNEFTQQRQEHSENLQATFQQQVQLAIIEKRVDLEFGNSEYLLQQLQRTLDNLQENIQRQQVDMAAIETRINLDFENNQHLQSALDHVVAESQRHQVHMGAITNRIDVESSNNETLIKQHQIQLIKQVQQHANSTMATIQPQHALILERISQLSQQINRVMSEQQGTCGIMGEMASKQDQMSLLVDQNTINLAEINNASRQKVLMTTSMGGNSSTAVDLIYFDDTPLATNTATVSAPAFTNSSSPPAADPVSSTTTLTDQKHDDDADNEELLEIYPTEKIHDQTQDTPFEASAQLLFSQLSMIEISTREHLDYIDIPENIQDLTVTMDYQYAKTTDRVHLTSLQFHIPHTTHYYSINTHRLCPQDLLHTKLGLLIADENIIRVGWDLDFIQDAMVETFGFGFGANKINLKRIARSMGGSQIKCDTFLQAVVNYLLWTCSGLLKIKKRELTRTVTRQGVQKDEEMRFLDGLTHDCVSCWMVGNLYYKLIFPE